MFKSIMQEIILTRYLYMDCLCFQLNFINYTRVKNKLTKLAYNIVLWKLKYGWHIYFMWLVLIWHTSPFFLYTVCISIIKQSVKHINIPQIPIKYYANVYKYISCAKNIMFKKKKMNIKFHLEIGFFHPKFYYKTKTDEIIHRIRMIHCLFFFVIFFFLFFSFFLSFLKLFSKMKFL